MAAAARSIDDTRVDPDPRGRQTAPESALAARGETADGRDHGPGGQRLPQGDRPRPDGVQGAPEGGRRRHQEGDELAKAKHGKNAENRAGRATNAGRIEVYIHHDGKQAAMVEVNCETDFVARNDEFRQLCKDLAVHILGANPQFVRREEMPAEVAGRAEAGRLVAEAANKPEAIREKIVEGKLSRWAGENGVLLDQPFVKDDAKTIRQLIQEVNARTGENISVGRFARFIVGERPTGPADRGGRVTRRSSRSRPTGVRRAVDRLAPGRPRVDLTTSTRSHAPGEPREWTPRRLTDRPSSAASC